MIEKKEGEKEGERKREKEEERDVSYSWVADTRFRKCLNRYRLQYYIRSGQVAKRDVTTGIGRYYMPLLCHVLTVYRACCSARPPRGLAEPHRAFGPVRRGRSYMRQPLLYWSLVIRNRPNFVNNQSELVI